MRLLSLAVLATVLHLASPLQAQDTVLRPGDRIRIGLATGGQRVGVFQAVQDADLAFRVGGSPEVAPLSSIRLLEVSRGRRPGILTGVLGGILGAGVGGVLGCLANKDDYGVFCAGQDDTRVVIGAAAGGLVGAALGAWLGRRDRWEPIPLPRP